MHLSRLPRPARRRVDGIACGISEMPGLTVGQVDKLDAPERTRKGMGQYPIPVVILARWAVSRQDQGRGIGLGRLQDAIRRTLLIAERAGSVPC